MGREILFCGIIHDAENMELRLDTSRLNRLRILVKDIAKRRTVRLGEAQSLVGKLGHACKAIRAGRSFIRRMLNVLSRHDTKP